MMLYQDRDWILSLSVQHSMAQAPILSVGWGLGPHAVTFSSSVGHPRKTLKQTSAFSRAQHLYNELKQYLSINFSNCVMSIPSIIIAKFKRNLKSILLQVQNAFDYIEWFPENTLVDTAAKLLRDGQLNL